MATSCSIGGSFDSQPTQNYFSTTTLSDGRLENPIGDLDHIDPASSATIGGEPIAYGDETVSLRLIGSNGNTPTICTTTPKAEHPTLIDTAGHCSRALINSPLSPFPVQPMQGGNFSAKVEARYGDKVYAERPITAVAIDPNYLKNYLGKVAREDMMAFRITEPITNVAGLEPLPTLPVTMTHLITTGMSAYVIGYGGGDLKTAHKVEMTIQLEGNDPSTANGFKLMPTVKDKDGTNMALIGGDSGSAVFVEIEGKKYQIGRVSGKYIGGDWDNWAFISSSISEENRARSNAIYNQVLTAPAIPQPMHFLQAAMYESQTSAGINGSFHDTYALVEAVPQGTAQVVNIFNTHKNPDMRLESMHLRAGVVADQCVAVGEPTTPTDLEIKNVTKTTETGASSTVTTTIEMDVVAPEGVIPPVDTLITQIPVKDSCTDSLNTMRFVYVYPVAGGNNPDDPGYKPSSARYSFKDNEGTEQVREYNFTMTQGPAAGIAFMHDEHLEAYPGISGPITLTDGTVVELKSYFPEGYALCFNGQYFIYATVKNSDQYHLLTFHYGLGNMQTSHLLTYPGKPEQFTNTITQIDPTCQKLFLPQISR